MKEGFLSILQTPDSPLLVRAQTPSTFPSPQKGREGTLEAQFRGTLRSGVADYVIFFFTQLYNLHSFLSFFLPSLGAQR